MRLLSEHFSSKEMLRGQFTTPQSQLGKLEISRIPPRRSSGPQRAKRPEARHTASAAIRRHRSRNLPEQIALSKCVHG